MIKERILLIGGTGFLGHNLIIALKKKGYSITSISSKIKSNNPKIKNVNYVKCDLSNLRDLKKKLIGNYDYVLNFAGNINHSNKKETLKVHFKGFQNLIRIFSKKNIKLFLQVGSSLEYGKFKSPQREKYICKPISVYGKAKYLASKALVRSDIKKFIILRLYQVYGPFQKYDRLIPFVVKKCLKKKQFNCSDGHQLRDFLFIDDFVDLIFKILKNKNNNFGIYNVGYGRPFSVRKVIQSINEIVKKGSPNFGKIKMRKDEIKLLYPNITKVSKNFKWKPKVNLKNGLKKTIKFYKNNIYKRAS